MFASYLILLVSASFCSGKYGSLVAYQLVLSTLSFLSVKSRRKSTHIFSTLSIFIGLSFCFWQFLQLPIVLYFVAVLVLTLLLYSLPFYLSSRFYRRISYGFTFPFFFTLCSYAYRSLSPWSTQGLPDLATAESFYVPLASLFGIDGLTFLSSIIPSTLPLLYSHYHRSHSLYRNNTDKPKTELYLLSLTLILLFLTNAVDSVSFNHPDPVVPVSGVLLPRFQPPDYSVDGANEERIQVERKSIDWAFDVSERVAAESKIIVWTESMLNVSDYVNNVSTREELWERSMKFSAKYSVYLVFTYHCSYPNGTILNELVISDPQGDVIGSYSKRHPVFIAESTVEAATWSTSPLLVDTEFGKLGLAICHDLDFPSFIYELRNADLIIIPAWDWRQLSRNTFGSALRSAELGVPLLRVTHAGWSAVTNKFGKHVFGVSHFSREEDLETDCPDWIGQCNSAGILTFTVPISVKGRVTLNSFVSGGYILFPFLFSFFIISWFNSLLHRRNLDFSEVPLYLTKSLNW
ncbi:hypothetical protein P9112_013161 [Eukaryota sp. TZLM1-RC]